MDGRALASGEGQARIALAGARAENDFWRFSLRVYRAPGVADECIDVQERYGIDVNAMLFCAWLAAERATVLTEADLASIREAVSDWHERAVKPLRAARQAMKGLAGVEAIRTRTKGLELEAERIEQSKLFDLANLKWPAKESGIRDAALRGNLALFLRAHGVPSLDPVPALLRAAETEMRRSAARK